jgi:chemotaxis protein methyltransferase CheR
MPPAAFRSRASGGTPLALDGGRDVIEAWSCGCASGEEPLSLAILWRYRLQPAFPGLGLRILATDADPHLLERARSTLYPGGALREVPPELRRQAFLAVDDGFRPRPELLAGIAWRCADVRKDQPDRPFDLVLCRNLVFTYFGDALQRTLAGSFSERLRPGGCLVLGRRESLPAGLDGWRSPWPKLPVWRRSGTD